MRVAIYYPWVYLTSGAERVLLELTGRSRHEWTIFTNRFEPSRTFPGLADRHIVELAQVPVERSVGKVATAAWRVLNQRLPLDGYDALLVLCEGVGDLATFRNAKQPVFCICLTPLRPAFDEKYREHALNAGGRLRRVVLPLALGAFAWVDRRAWRRYRRVFCVSEEVRRRALAARLAPPERLEVLHVPAGVENALDTESVFEKFFLVPGRIMWTKNIQLAIQAFKQFCADSRNQDFRLVVAGMVDAKSEGYAQQLRDLAGDDPRIEFRIAPSDEELADLYRRCHAVLFTAFNEDWGLVPLESMSFGKPVIATDSGGPRETVAAGTGFLEEPEVSAFARRMVELAAQPLLARKMGLAGRERVRQFSWEAYVRRIDDVLEQEQASIALQEKRTAEPPPQRMEVSRPGT